MCSWDEFRDCCKLIGFNDDAPGAWRAMDVSLVGYLTIQDLDPMAAHVLLEFKDWATEEFGSVSTFFHACDEDGCNALKFTDFKKCCHLYGYERALGPIFKALDVQDDKLLTLQEITFLDTLSQVSRDSVKDDSEPVMQQVIKPEVSGPAEASLHAELPLVQSLSSSEWRVGALHPAFRSWANSRRKQPVTKLDGTLPDLALQVDLGSPRVATRPILLLAPVPIYPDKLPKRRHRALSDRSHRKAGQLSLPDSPVRSTVKPSLDSLLERRSLSPTFSHEQRRARFLD